MFFDDDFTFILSKYTLKFAKHYLKKIKINSKIKEFENENDFLEFTLKYAKLRILSNENLKQVSLKLLNVSFDNIEDLKFKLKTIFDFLNKLKENLKDKFLISYIFKALKLKYELISFDSYNNNSKQNIIIESKFITEQEDLLFKMKFLIKSKDISASKMLFSSIFFNGSDFNLINFIVEETKNLNKFAYYCLIIFYDDLANLKHDNDTKYNNDKFNNKEFSKFIYALEDIVINFKANDYKARLFIKRIFKFLILKHNKRNNNYNNDNDNKEEDNLDLLFEIYSKRFTNMNHQVLLKQTLNDNFK